MNLRRYSTSIGPRQRLVRCDTGTWLTWAVLRPELRFQPRDPSRLKRHPQSAIGAYGDAVRLGRR